MIRRGDGKFFTTEDAMATGVSAGGRIRLENALLTAVAEHPIAAYSMVKFERFGVVSPLSGGIIPVNTVCGIVEADADVGDPVDVIREGMVTNSDWLFEKVNELNDK